MIIDVTAVANPIKSRHVWMTRVAGMTQQPAPRSDAYRLLEAGPVVLVTTAYRGRANVMTMGFT